ncbi:MAG TPA: flagellar basal body-associated FliL family protein [Longimicrobiaceae bacterium]|nr:flagellar basal body-associated FliL family protein [Longimicrobiaceae bacterium]
MPNETDPEVVAEVPTEEEQPKKSRLLLAIVVTVGVLAGGGGGALYVGPLVAARLHPRVAQADAASDSAASADAGPSIIHQVDNLVMNPAGSNGTRFLMLTVAFDVKDESVGAQMQARDAEIRDAVLGVLGTKSVEELADVSRRDTLKAQMLAAVAKLFPAGAVKRVYLPQFVIQ